MQTQTELGQSHRDGQAVPSSTSPTPTSQASSTNEMTWKGWGLAHVGGGRTQKGEKQAFPSKRMSLPSAMRKSFHRGITPKVISLSEGGLAPSCTPSLKMTPSTMRSSWDTQPLEA